MFRYISIFSEKKKIKYISLSKWNYKNYKKKKFDIIILIDVLHHIGINKSYKILNELSQISKYILIKEHFEYGFISRQLLRLADFYGNYAQNVNVPNIYFSKNSWEKLVKNKKLNLFYFEKNVQQHKGLFNYILNPKHHFISIIKN